MAPTHEDTHIAKGAMTYMGLYSERKYARYVKKIAASPELKEFLFHLSEKAPSIVLGLLKKAVRKCEDSLGVERERKRVQRSNGKGGRVKRVKITHSIGDKISSSQRVAGLNVVVQARTIRQRLQEAGVDAHSEESDEADRNMELMEDEHSSVAVPSTHVPQEDDTKYSPTKYQVECGLTMGVPSIINHVTTSLLALKPSMTRTQFKVDEEIAKLLKMLPFLEAYKAQRELLKYLNEREEKSSEELQAPIDWDVSDPSEILDALESVKRKTSDNKIHRAYGQMKLFSSVRGQVAQGYKSTITGHRSDHTAILEELARKKSGSLSKSETVQMIKDNHDEYYAGQKWSAVVDWFGGNGIVLVFVTAGIGPHYVEKKWTEFQRICLQHVAGLLPNIRELVAALGSDALELYCRYGCLGTDCIKRLAKAEFTEPDGDDDDEGSEDEEGGEDDEESEDDENSEHDEESEYGEGAGDDKEAGDDEK